MEEKVLLIEKLFYQLEQEINNYQNNVDIRCVSGCGKCCTHPTIEASPLEFLPWAFHLFLNGEADKTLEILNQQKTPTCYLYTPLSIVDRNNGSCGNYKYRGLICRLFGTAASTDKYGKLRLITCKIIKEGQAATINDVSEKINQGLSIPLFTNYYMQLNQIDYHLASKIVPINQALKLAIEEVLQYYAYRPMPTPFVKSA